MNSEINELKKNLHNTNLSLNELKEAFNETYQVKEKESNNVQYLEQTNKVT